MTSDSVPSDLNAMPQEPCDARNADSEADEAGLSDLDHALADWAFRHGADELVACGFAIANWAVTQGHTCLALNAIPRNLMRAQMQRALPAALAASLLAGGPGSRRPLIVEDGMLYLQRYHAYETQLAERLRQLLAAPPELVDVARLQRGHGLFDVETEAHDGTNWQAVAAFVALRHRFSVISGGPGTGKTYIIVRLLRVLIESALAGDRPPPRIALAAPTGKAAARMVDGMRGGLEAMAAEPTSSSLITQHIPTVAMTLHRLLGLTGSTTKPRYHADNPVPADVVIVDEASMVDLPLMAKLAAAVRADGRLILLGDRYQLASVESGSVLAGICSNAGVNSFTKEQQNAAGGLIEQAAEPNPDILGDHVVTLQTSRRFNADSNIGRLARAVNAGDAVTVHDLLSAGHADLIYRNGAGGAAIERLMDEQTEHYDSLRQATDPALAVAQLAKCCILTAVRNGVAGSRTINAGITERLARQHGFDPAATWYPGRPVIVTRNNYRTGLFNGDVGVALRGHDGPLRVWFSGNDGIPRAFLPSALPTHETVYAMTIHKSQGSEFDGVTLVLPDYDLSILTRELFYTGLSRGRTRLTVYARPDILDIAIERRVIRHSGLAGRLSDTGIEPAVELR